MISFCFFFKDTATTEIYTLSLHDALPISAKAAKAGDARGIVPRRQGARPRFPDVRHEKLGRRRAVAAHRSEEHTSELQSPVHLVCRLLLEKKNKSNHSVTKLHLKYYSSHS